MSEKKERKEQAEQLELSNDLHNIDIETAAYRKENQQTKVTKKSQIENNKQAWHSQKQEIEKRRVVLT